MAAVRKTRYSAADIQVLEGLEPVRKRPAMYIGGTDTTGYHHLLWEILDNSVDEVINGFATRIEVTLREDGRTMTVIDDGRGIPVDVMPKYKKPAIEVILTTLHSGGKFDKGNYIHSGGLHGVGSSVVNALSSKLVAEVKRDGKRWVQTYAKGHALSKLKAERKAKGTGTSITFEPDAEIFGLKLKFDPAPIRDRLEARSYLHRGMEVVFRDQTAEPPAEVTFKHEGGIAEFLGKVVAERAKPTIPPQNGTSTQFYRSSEGDGRMEVALLWTEATDEHVRSYVNGIPTPQGGTHEAGLRSGVVKAVRNYIETHDLTPKGVTLTAEDIREGVVAILSVYVIEPQFQGQTKGRLNNAETSAQVDGIVRPALEKWLNDNRTIAEAVVARITLAARAREASRAASQAGPRQGNGLGCGQAALRPHLPLDGRRLGRAPHRHAPPDLLLPAPARADHGRGGPHRPAAALPHRRRQGNLLGARRGRPRPHPEGAREGQRQAADHAVQGAGRDDRGRAEEHHP